jgi:hypothetical protein
MRHRHFTLLTILALVVAACGGEGTEDSTTSSAAESTTTTASVEAVELSYTLEPGASYQYEVDMNQTIDLSTSGDTSALGQGEDLPGDMSLVMAGTTTFTYGVAEGPETGTYEVTISGDFSDLEFSGTIDGEQVDSSEIPEMAEMEPVDVTIVVDEQGNVIPDDSAGPGEDLLGGLGGMNMLDQFGAATPGQFIGPPFSDGEFTVGDTWSETVETPMMPDADPIVTTVESEVASSDEVDGNEVFVIETTSTTSAFEFDLGELLIGFMTAFVPEDATEEELAELDAIVEQLRFAFSVDESTSNMTTWFDYAAGVSRQAEVTGDTHMVMDVNIPDETTGDLAEFEMDMTIGQDLTYRLIDGSAG